MKRREMGWDGGDVVLVVMIGEMRVLWEDSIAKVLV